MIGIADETGKFRSLWSLLIFALRLIGIIKRRKTF
jgi:hypothetical protein